MNQSNPGIDITAAEWAVRLHEHTLSAQEQIELDQWLNADTRHLGALLRARAMWSDLDRLAALAGRTNASGSQVRGFESLRSLPAQPDVEAPEPPALKSPLLAHEHLSFSHQPRRVDSSARSAEQGREASSHRFSPRRRRLVVGGVAAAVFGSAGAWWLARRDGTYVSNVGEIQRVTLSDGSRMVLNTSTEAIVHFDKKRREIELAAGEGIFEVTKDVLRPFIVRAGSVSVRAIGTVFAVRSGDQRVDVTVTQGMVEIADNGAASNAVIRRVAANQHATVMETREVQVQSISYGEAERRLAWRDGVADFAGESLETAVQEINRHNHRRIVIDDTALASRPVVGVFRVDDPDGFAATVATALGAQNVVLNDTIHLQVRSRP